MPVQYSSFVESVRFRYRVPNCEDFKIESGVVIGAIVIFVERFFFKLLF